MLKHPSSYANAKGELLALKPDRQYDRITEQPRLHPREESREPARRWENNFNVTEENNWRKNKAVNLHYFTFHQFVLLIFYLNESNYIR